MSGVICTKDFEKSFVADPFTGFPVEHLSSYPGMEMRAAGCTTKNEKDPPGGSADFAYKKEAKNFYEISLCITVLSSPFPIREAGRLLLHRERGDKPMSPPIIYIASAYSGDIDANVAKTKEYSRRVIESGGVPFNPILNLHGVLSEETDRDTAISIDLSLLERCDELWAFGEPTAGMRIEIAEAEKQGMKTRFFGEVPDER